jgi:predicted dehydrogenase
MTRVAVLGYGYWGPNVARNFSALSDCELYAVCDPDPVRLEVAKGLYPAIECRTRYQDLLDDDAVDAIAICTPVHTHYEMAKASLLAGKHVLVEKPMTSSVKTSEELVHLAAVRGLTLQVDHTFVYSAPVQAIRGMIDSGSLGDVLYIDSMRINLGLFRSEVGVLWDLAVHDVSIINHLIGQRPIWVSASGAAPYGNFENLAYITLMYPNELIAHVNVNWLSPVKLRSMVIGGSAQMVVYDDLAPSEKLKIYDKGVSIIEDDPAQKNLLVDYRVGSMTAPHLARIEPLTEMCSDYIRAITTSEPPLVDGEAGLEVVRIVSAAAESLKKAGERITLPARVS